MYRALPDRSPPSRHIGDIAKVSAGRRLLTAAIFLAVFFYFWIGLSPFPEQYLNLSNAPYGGQSNRLNQIIVVLMSGGLLFFVLGKANRTLLLRPRSLLIAILVWFSFVSLFAGDPASAYRRIVFSLLVCACSSAILLLPRSREQFTDLMTIAVPTILGLSYFGVVVLPHLAVHSANASDPSLIGDWRGHFPHKNVAAPAMVFSVFFGLYVLRAKSLLAGSAIIGLAAVFLWNTGSKTSIAMLPSILVLGWMFERIRILRPVVVLGGLVAVNVILMSAATSSTLQSFLVSLGIDPSFTDRTSIWSVGLDAFARNPITGYGFRSFWQTEALFRSDFSLYTWAVTAAHAHNGYLEQLLNGGMVGLVLVLIWLVLLPIGYASRAFAGPNNSDLTRLFLRLWLFSLFLACLESPIFENTGPIWFAMLVSVFGLRLQAYALLLDPSPRKAATGSNTIVAANCR